MVVPQMKPRENTHPWAERDDGPEVQVSDSEQRELLA
jgi:hypothetical protein